MSENEDTTMTVYKFSPESEEDVTERQTPSRHPATDIDSDDTVSGEDEDDEEDDDDDSEDYDEDEEG